MRTEQPYESEVVQDRPSPLRGPSQNDGLSITGFKARCLSAVQG